MYKSTMKRFSASAITTVMLSTASISLPSSVHANEYWLGQVITFAGNFCPRGTRAATGNLLPISQNTALFSLLGTNYGGDGRTTFGLPDLRDRSPVHISGDYRGVGIIQNFGANPATSNSGGSLAMSMCIVTEGIFPSRS